MTSSVVVGNVMGISGSSISFFQTAEHDLKPIINQVAYELALDHFTSCTQAGRVPMSADDAEYACSAPPRQSTVQYSAKGTKAAKAPLRNQGFALSDQDCHEAIMKNYRDEAVFASNMKHKEHDVVST
jgi:hypothetical protein